MARRSAEVVGWLRFAWTTLTSMRTALILLLVLGIAAVPGSLQIGRASCRERV